MNSSKDAEYDCNSSIKKEKVNPPGNTNIYMQIEPEYT